MKISVGGGGGGAGRASSMYYYDDMRLGGGGDVYGGGGGGGGGGGYHTISGYQASSGYQGGGGIGGGGTYQVISGGGGGGFQSGGGYQSSGGFQSGGGGGYQQQMTMTRTVSRAAPPPDVDTLSLRSMRIQPMPVASWVGQDDSDGGSLKSEQQHPFYTSNGISQTASSSATQIRTSTAPPPMRRSLSGTLGRSAGGGGGMVEASMERQYSFKGPAFRTINRINQRNNRMSMGSTSGGSVYGGGGGFVMSGSQGNLGGRISRAMSTKSMQSVGRGLDVFDGEMSGSMGNLAR